MKRNILYLLVGLFAFLPGCLKEQQDLFPSSAAVRINSTIEGIDSVLTHAHNGWLMQYFADSVSPGYSMLVSFNENSETKVAAKNELVGNEYTEAVSVFDVIGDNGPVLTFNTFNDVLHLFSNPVNPDGVGLGGDYEFVVKAYSDSLLRMRGKKNGAEIVMTPLPVNLSWREYLDKLEGVDAELFGVEPIYLVSSFVPMLI